MFKQFEVPRDRAMSAYSRTAGRRTFARESQIDQRVPELGATLLLCSRQVIAVDWVLAGVVVQVLGRAGRRLADRSRMGGWVCVFVVRAVLSVVGVVGAAEPVALVERMRGVGLAGEEEIECCDHPPEGTGVGAVELP